MPVKPYDIVYGYLFSPYFNNLPSDVQHSFFKPGVWCKILSVLKTIIHEVRQLLRKEEETRPIAGKMWIVVDAINNLQSVEFILARNSEIELVTTSRSLAQSQPRVKHLSSVLRSRFMFRMIWYILKNRRRVGNRWDLFLRESGWYEVALEQLKKFKPASILFTNDHTPVNRARMMAAKKLGIPTGYIQHACVREDFGELLVDHAFLDGQDSADKYSKHTAKYDSQFYLVGMPRFAPFLSFRKKSTMIKSIGIAYNTTDDMKEVETLISVLKEYEVIIRPHPKDNRKPINASNLSFSEPAKENAAHFLNKIDALIAGESAIHLEAVLLNIPSFLYDLNHQSGIKDLYGFEKQGLIKRFQKPDKLLTEIQKYNREPHDVFMNAAYYNSMTGTAQESSSDSLAYELIHSKLMTESK